MAKRTTTAKKPAAKKPEATAAEAAEAPEQPTAKKQAKPRPGDTVTYRHSSGLEQPATIVSVEDGGVTLEYASDLYDRVRHTVTGVQRDDTGEAGGTWRPADAE